MAASPAIAGSYLVSHVSVLPMDRERVLPDRDVLIVGNRIEAIEPAGRIDVPDGVVRIDGRERFLLPGLGEMHAHVPTVRRPDYLERVLALYAAAGVTTIRGMLGEPGHLELRRRLADGELIGPRLFTSGPSLNGRSVDGVDNAVAMVHAQAKAGYDFLKIHPGLSSAEFEAVARAATLEGIAFAGHVTADAGLQQVLASGQATIDHLDGYLQALLPDDVDPATLDTGFFAVGIADRVDASSIRALAERTAARGVWNVPTLTLIENMARPQSTKSLVERPEMRFMPDSIVGQWAAARDAFLRDARFAPDTLERAADLRLAIVGALHEAGAGLLLGSDAPQVFNVPGFAIHREMERMHAAGLSRYEVLETGTVNVARFFGVAERLGKVAVGYEADLVLLDANPLESFDAFAAPAGVMLRGRWLPRAELDALLKRYADD